STIRPRLLASDVHLGRAVNRRQRDGRSLALRPENFLRRSKGALGPFGNPPLGLRVSGITRGCGRRPFYFWRLKLVRAVYDPTSLHIFVEAFAAAFATEAALAITAEATTGIEQIRRIDPDGARLNAPRHVERLVDILAPDARCQAIPRVVR